MIQRRQFTVTMDVGNAPGYAKEYEIEFMGHTVAYDTIIGLQTRVCELIGFLSMYGEFVPLPDKDAGKDNNK